MRSVDENNDGFSRTPPTDGFWSVDLLRRFAGRYLLARAASKEAGDFDGGFVYLVLDDFYRAVDGAYLHRTEP